MDAATGRREIRAGGGATLLPRGREWALLAAYALGFFVAHRWAAWWGGEGFYSLWFPAAGVRLALLWGAGARFAPAAALVELGVQTATGVVDPARPDWASTAVGIVRPPLAYGLAVWAVRRLSERPRSPLATPPMPFGLAAVAAPVATALSALPWSLLRPDFTGVETARDVVASLTAFAVGDLLGALLVAPPLLWAAELAAGKRPNAGRLSVPHMVETAGVTALSLGAAAALSLIGLGLPATPILLAVAWVGLRFGRAAAWAAIAAAAAFVLPRTAAPMALGERLELHMNLAAIAVAGYLAGSFTDALARARADLRRRDRLLFQAERLKTLRAMSVAVIHEVSQPLSTLAIEARHLHELSVSADPEIAAGAALIDRKAHALSDLVRRLRRFGGRAADEPSPLPVAQLLDTVRGLAAAEAKAARVILEVEPCDPDLVVVAQEVELAQAAVNLVRNALQACDDGVVRVFCLREDDEVAISVSNRCAAAAPAREGMGVGLLVARAIVEAHGGRIERAVDSGVITHRILLPLAGEPL